MGDIGYGRWFEFCGGVAVLGARVSERYYVDSSKILSFVSPASLYSNDGRACVTGESHALATFRKALMRLLAVCICRRYVGVSVCTGEKRRAIEYSV